MEDVSNKIIEKCVVAINSTRYKGKDLLEAIDMPPKAYKEFSVKLQETIDSIKSHCDSEFVELEDWQFKSLLVNELSDTVIYVSDFLFDNKKRKDYFIQQCITTFKTIFNR